MVALVKLIDHSNATTSFIKIKTDEKKAAQQSLDWWRMTNRGDRLIIN